MSLESAFDARGFISLLLAVPLEEGLRSRLFFQVLGQLTDVPSSRDAALLTFFHAFLVVVKQGCFLVPCVRDGF